MSKIIAIGDVHGDFEKLKSLVEYHLEKDENVSFVFLGDIIDRGQKSYECVEYIYDLLNVNKGSILLKGNHEEFFIDNVILGKKDDNWFLNGGLETITSYAGYEMMMELDEYQMFSYLREKFPHHIDLFKNSKNIFLKDKFIFVHAGVNPDNDIDKQNDSDLLWIRNKFLSYKGIYGNGKIVIHGHTPLKTITPEIHINRINLDTASVFGGALSSLTIDMEKMELNFHQCIMNKDKTLSIREIDPNVFPDVLWINEFKINNKNGSEFLYDSYIKALF